jgi:hypothetical protein
MEYQKELSNRVIGLALTVHRTLGPGLLESAYEEDDATSWHRWEFCYAKLHATSVLTAKLIAL